MNEASGNNSGTTGWRAADRALLDLPQSFFRSQTGSGTARRREGGFPATALFLATLTGGVFADMNAPPEIILGQTTVPGGPATGPGRETGHGVSAGLERANRSGGAFTLELPINYAGRNVTPTTPTAQLAA